MNTFPSWCVHVYLLQICIEFLETKKINFIFAYNTQKNISPISTTIFIHKEFLQPHVQYRLSEIFTVALEWSKNSLRFDQVHTL